jgi:hypothetical protein
MGEYEFNQIVLIVASAIVIVIVVAVILAALGTVELPGFR